MGSGTYGSYGASGGSQPYAPFYNVVKEELENDKKDPDIYSPNSGYFKNPNARKLQDAIIDGRVRDGNKGLMGKFTYVLDEEGNIIFGKRCNPNNENKRAPHPTLIGGKNPKVQCAGMITINKGRITKVNCDSGHYRPDRKSLEKVMEALRKLAESNPSIIARNFKWR